MVLNMVENKEGNWRCVVVEEDTQQQDVHGLGNDDDVYFVREISIFAYTRAIGVFTSCHHHVEES